jgi:hypothetical protein
MYFLKCCLALFHDMQSILSKSQWKNLPCSIQAARKVKWEIHWFVSRGVLVTHTNRLFLGCPLRHSTMLYTQNWLANSTVSIAEVTQRLRRDDGYARWEDWVEISRASLKEMSWHSPERVERNMKSAGGIVVSTANIRTCTSPYKSLSVELTCCVLLENNNLKSIRK